MASAQPMSSPSSQTEPSLSVDSPVVLVATAPVNDASEDTTIADLADKRKLKLAQLKSRWSATVIQSNWRGHATRKRSMWFRWPSPLREDFTLPELNAPLLEDQLANLGWIGSHRRLLVRALTWNLCAQIPPPSEYFATMLPRNRYHLIVVGSEECERSIAQSALNPSKKNWEFDVQQAVGTSYVPIRSHTLQAIHIIVYAHVSIVSIITEVTSAAIPMGIGNTLGNKGGVAVAMLVGKTRFAFVNAHLEAHQGAWTERNTQANRLHEEMAGALRRGVASKIINGNGSTDIGSAGVSQSAKVADQPLDTFADRVIFMGDFNYRLNGNRDAVDSMLRLRMHEALVSNDQLKLSQARGEAFVRYTEAPLNFRPTYKFDIDSDVYDSSLKRRIPSWTDRILYAPNGMRCVAYNSDPNVRTSDHRPVFATFSAAIEFESDYIILDHKREIEYAAPSQVCTLM